MPNADDMLKLKELLDKEVITQEEFNEKKRQFLNQDVKEEPKETEDIVDAVQNFNKSNKNNIQKRKKRNWMWRSNCCFYCFNDNMRYYWNRTI